MFSVTKTGCVDFRAFSPKPFSAEVRANMADDEVMAEVEQQTATRGPDPGGVAPWVEEYRPATIDELR